MPENASALLILFVMAAVYLLPLWLFLFAWWIGSSIEAKHFASIREREAATANLPAIPSRTADSSQMIAESRLVTGSVVISIDYFKRVISGFRKIFGGRIHSFETLVDRARREAILRMKAECPSADIILNLRLDTSTISSHDARNQTVGVEVISSGTAIWYRKAA